MADGGGGNCKSDYCFRGKQPVSLTSGSKRYGRRITKGIAEQLTVGLNYLLKLQIPK